MSYQILHQNKRNYRQDTYRIHMHYFKMNKAKILLVTQQYTVTEIATFLGFCNAKYFGKRFKKFYKVPPTQYIKEVF
ncbi:helix-turn-helix domain-containing protein [Bacteroides fragilis]